MGDLEEAGNEKRPDWLWEKRADGSYEYWTREKVEIRAYIDHLERSAGDARRKMDEVIFTLRGKTGTASKRAEYAVEQITKIMGVLDVNPVVKHELSCIWPNDDRVKCNGYRDGNCVLPIRREEICKDIPEDPVTENGKVLMEAKSGYRGTMFLARPPPKDVGRPQSDAMGGTEEPNSPLKVTPEQREHLLNEDDDEAHAVVYYRPPTEEITPVVEWPDTDECPLSHEKHPECEGCNLEGDCTRGEHILRHRKMEEGEQMIVHVDDHVRVFGSKDPPEEQKDPFTELVESRYGSPEEPPNELTKHFDSLDIEPPVTYAEPERIPPSKGRVWKEPTTILCPQCKQPVNRTYDHVKGGVGGGATGHYECPEPPKEPVLPPNFKMAPEYPPEEPHTVNK